MEEVYIVSAVRTPLGKFGGVLANFSPVDLGAIAMRAALERAGVAGEFDLYIFGNVLRAGHGQSLPRQAAFKAGISEKVGGTWTRGESWRFPEVPILAVNKLLDKLKMRIFDFDLFENNEAFALSKVLFNRELGRELAETLTTKLSPALPTG